MQKGTENNRRSTGQVKEAGDGYLPNGNPDLSPSAGYEKNQPVQYADESDAQFALRESDFQIRWNHAKDIENGGQSLDSKKKEIQDKADAEIAAAEMAHERWDSNRKQTVAEAGSNVAPKK